MTRYLLMGSVMAWALTAGAAVRYVAKTGDNANDGSAGSPWQTVQHAITTAAAGDEIRVGEGTYTENVVVPYSTRNNLVLKGGYNPADWSWSPGAYPTVIESAAGTGSDVLQLRSVAVSVIGFTLRGGYYGINCRGGSAEGTYTITHCRIESNANHGVRMQADGGVKSSVNMRNTLIVNNGGNGVYINCDNATGYSYLYHCTIADNAGHGYADVNGSHKDTFLTNCIIARNGGVGAVHATSLYTKRSILAFSCLYGNAGGPLSSGFAASMGPTWLLQDGFLQGDPGFAGGGDYRLAEGSPCIGTGTNLSIVTDDITGAPRSGAVDMGCYQSSFSAAARHAVTYADAAKADDSGDGASPATATRTIGAALARTAPGGTCRVADGRYEEMVVVAVPGVTLEGEDRETTTITNRLNAGIWVISTNVTVRGFTVEGPQVCLLADQPHTTAAVLTNRIEQCVLRNGTIGLLVPWGNVPVLTQRLTVERCIVTNNASHGIQVMHRHALVGLNLLVAENGGMGIHMNADNCPYDSYLYHCTIANNASHGLLTEHASQRQAFIKNCLFSGNGGYGFRRMGSAAGALLLDYVQYSCSYGNALGDWLGDNAADRIVFQGGNLSANPTFPGDGDYRLGPDSYCLKAGIDLSADAIPVTNDLEGTLRTAPYDVGCYQTPHAAPAKHAAVFADAAMADDAGDGLSPATAKQRINSAAVMAAAGGTVSVAPGLYRETVLPPANMTIAGAGAEVTVVTGTWYTALFQDTNTVVSGITFQSSGHRVVRLNGASNTLRDCVVEKGYACGVTVAAHGNRLEGCTLSRNSIGLQVGANVRAVVDRCVISDNTSHGVFCNNKGALEARNSLVAGNGGDGIYLSSDNSSYLSYIDYCTIAGNAVNGYRDDMSWHRGTVMTNTIISGNGFGYRRIASPNNNNTLGHTLVAGNTGGDFAGGRIVLQAGMITNQLPAFLPGSYRLAASSPAVDAALDIGIAVDLAGAARPLLGGFDMGAYETPPLPGTLMIVR